MSATQLSATAPPNRSVARRAAAAQGKAERRARIRRENAERQERIDEAIAPAIQRLGTEAKVARLVRDGISFRVASPIAYLVAKGRSRERNGDQPTITAGHQRAAERLLRSWEMSRTITIGTGKYGDAVGGSVDVGVMSRTVIDNVTRQYDAAVEVSGARGALGATWSIVEWVALNGFDCRTWAEREKLPLVVSYGYLRAGLDLLVGFYRAGSGG